MSIFYQTATRIGCRYPAQPLPKVAPNIHVPALLHRPEKGPHIDPVGSQRDNLQKWWKLWFVKYKFISNMPYCPYKCTDSHSYIYFLRLTDTIQPSSKEMINTARWSNIKSHMNNCPDNLSKRTLNEKILHGLPMITKATWCAPLPIPFLQIIFC
jgi:hypothetical protein